MVSRTRCARPGAHPAARTRLADRRRLRPDRRCRPTGGGSRRVANERRARRRPETDFAVPGSPGAGAAAAAAVNADLVGIDLLPTPDGSWVVIEVNGAVEFTDDYSLDRNVFVAAAEALADAAFGSRREPLAIASRGSPLGYQSFTNPCTQSHPGGEGSVKQWQGADRRGRRRHREGDGDAPHRSGVRPLWVGKRRGRHGPFSATSGRTSASST